MSEPADLGTMGDYRYLPCPTCGARAGHACYTRSGDDSRAIHVARRRAVEALWPSADLCPCPPDCTEHTLCFDNRPSRLNDQKETTSDGR